MRLLYDNKYLDATLTATSEDAYYPVENTQDAVLAKKYKSESTTTYINIIEDVYNFQYFGDQLYISNCGAVSMTLLYDNVFAFIDSYNKELRTYQCVDGTFSTIGNSLFIPGLGATTIDSLNSSTIVLLGLIGRKMVLC